MADPVRIDPERLLAQTAWVRRLALSLSRDEASADDLVQDALAAALRRPPPDAASEGALRAWFASVTRHLAIHRTRTDSRRIERERHASRPELERTQERLRELEELRAELVQHVLTLSGENQQVILLHFFEELDSAEIARRLSVPDSTIRNRLRRALAELRDRIERKHGPDWRNLCLFVLPASGAKLAAGSGAALGALVVVGNGWLLAASLALLAGASWFALHGAPASLELESASVASPAARPAALESDALASSAPASAREPLAGAAAGAAALFCQGELRSSSGAHIDEASVELRDAQRVRVAHQEHVSGWYVLAGLAPGRYTLAAEAEHFRPRTLELELTGRENPARADLVLEPQVRLQVRILDEHGEPLGRDARGRSSERELGLAVVATRAQPPAELSASPSEYVWYDLGHWMTPELTGGELERQLAPGSTGLLEIREDLPCWVALVLRGRVLESRLVSRDDERLEFRVESSLLEREPSSAHARFLDAASGAPIEGLEVELAPMWRSGGAQTTDARGEVRFEGLPLVPLRLDYRGLRRELRLRPGVNELGTIPVPAVRTLRVRILDPDGRPAGGSVSWILLENAPTPPEWDAPGEHVLRTGETATIEALAARLLVRAIAPRGKDWVVSPVVVDAGNEAVEIELHAVRAVEVELVALTRETAPCTLVLRTNEGTPSARVDLVGERSARTHLALGRCQVEGWIGTRRVFSRALEVTSDTRRLEFEF